MIADIGSELYLTQKKAAVSVVIAGKAAFLEVFKAHRYITLIYL